MKKREHYEEIPEEIRDAITGLDSKQRQTIFIDLLRNGELSFSQLKKMTGLTKPNLNFHLKKLTKSMLVEHSYRDQIGNEQFSFYSVTPFGHNFLDALIHSLTPSMSIAETTEQETIIDININVHRTTRKLVKVPASVSGKQLRTIIPARQSR